MPIEITIQAPALTEALQALAAAINSSATHAPQMSAPPQINTALPVARTAHTSSSPASAAPKSSASMPAPVPAYAPAPTPVPAAPAPAPAQVSTPMPTPAPTAPAPAPQAPPPPSAPAYTPDQLMRAGTYLMDMGKQPDLLNLLAQYQVQSINQLSPEQYGAFATALRGLGAQI